jgi:hypothetical protein
VGEDMKYKGSVIDVSEADVKKCELDLMDQMGVSILFLNYHGVAIERVRELMIDSLDRSLQYYKDENILDEFKEKMKNV